MKKYQIEVRCFEDENNSNNMPYYGIGDSGDCTVVIVGASETGDLLSVMLREAHADLIRKEADRIIEESE